MFEQLISILHEAWSKLTPVMIVPVYQNAGVLRFGKYRATLLPGLHWKIPVVDEVHCENIVMTTLRLPPQTCTTKDNKSVVIASVIKYRIVNVQPYICEVWDQTDVLTDVTMGANLTAIRETDFEELVSKPPEGKIATAVRRKVNKYGFEIDSVTFTDIGQIRTIRLMTQSALDHHRFAEHFA